MNPFHTLRARSGLRSASQLGACLLATVLLLGSVQADSRDGSQFSYISLHDDGRPAISYALVRPENNMIFSGHSDELKSIKAFARRHAGSYLWFRTDGQYYRIEEPATLEKLAGLWQAMAPYEQQLEPLDDEMEAYGEQMEALEWDRDELDEDESADAGKAAELAERSEALSDKMEQLSERMQQLSEQIEQLSQTADEQTLAAIDEAMTNGTAKPIAR